LVELQFVAQGSATKVEDWEGQEFLLVASTIGESHEGL
jgi:hypothetical protein